MVVEHNQRRTWRYPLREPRDAPLGGHCGEMTQIEGRVPTINIPAHLSLHPNGFREILPFLLIERRKKVRRYDTTQPWGSMQSRGSTKSRKEQVKPIVGKDRVYIFFILRWDDIYLPCNLPHIYSPSLSPPPLPLNLRTPDVAPQLCT